MKNNSRSFFYVLLIFVLFVGCATTNTKAIMESWIDHHKSELIKSWGPPNRITSDGQGGQILIYENSTTNAYTFNNLFGVELDNPVTTVNTRTQYYQFYTNSRGTIYHIRWGTN